MSLSVERLGGKVMHMVQECPHCGTESRCRRREFSEQTWSVLLAWGEVEYRTVDQPLCDECYDDVREILIDRADEVAKALTQPAKIAQSAAKSSAAKKAAASTPAKKKAAAGRGRAKRSSRVA